MDKPDIKIPTDFKCYCFNVEGSWINGIVVKYNCDTYRDVWKHCPVGTKCGACVCDIQNLCDRNKNAIQDRS